MRLSYLLILISILCLFAFLSTAFTWDYLGQKTVVGVVVDAASGNPVSAATIQVGEFSTESDAEGHFLASLSQAKNVYLEAQAPGYLPLAFTFDLPWYLRTGRLNVPLTPLGISFKVIDSWTNRPLANLEVAVADMVYHTNASGEFQVSNLPPTWPILVSINQPGYLSHQIKLARLPDNSAELPIILNLEPHTLTGFVVAQDTQEPLAGAVVSTAGKTTVTDGDGRFFLFRLQSDQAISVLADKAFMAADFIFAGQSTLTIELPPRQLAITVVEAITGQPISNTLVEGGGQIVRTNTQGQANLLRLPTEGTLQISHSGYLGQKTAYHIDLPMTIALVPNTMSGVVRDAYTSQPLTATQVLLNGIPLNLDINGRYSLTELAQNQTLQFKSSGYQSAVLRFRVEDDFTVAAEKLAVAPCLADHVEPLCLDILLQPFTAKAVYIPFNLLADEESIRAIFDLIDRTELNAVILDVKGDRGYLAWDSQVLQADELEIDGQRAGWLGLDSFLAQAKARNIYTIARMVIFKDNPLAFGYPDLAITDAAGTIWLDGEGLAWANPFRQEVWDYNIALAEEIATLGFDEINLDYIRFPSDGNLGAITFAEENTLETRTTAIRTFISRVDQALIPYGTFLSADLFGLTVWVDPADDMNIGQRVIDIAPYVDYLSPMIYPSTFAPGNLGLADPSASPYEVIFHSQQVAISRVPATTKVRPWLQGYWYSVEEMLLQKQAANDANAAGWAWWNAGGVYQEAVFELDSK